MALTLNATARISSTWTVFKTSVVGKSLQVQQDDDGVTYSIFAIDGPIVYDCTIWKGIVPDGVVNSGYSQSQNNTDKTDFETNYLPTGNQRLLQPVATVVLSTYVVEVALAGANNKDMISIFNPNGSGKILQIREFWGLVPSSSGTTVIIPFEIRRATEVTTGTTVTINKFDTTDLDSVAIVRQAPTGITDSGLLYTWVEQINTAQGSTDAHTQVVNSGMSVDQIKPLILRPNQGIYIKQIANNTSTFRMGALWTEE
jgi:hypothetical protein